MKKSLSVIIGLVYALVPAMIFEQCADNPTYPPSPPCTIAADTTAVVYIAGAQTIVDRAGRSVNYAAYWKNNQVITLTDSTENSHAYDVAVLGKDVYVVGVIAPIATYWKNDVAVALSGSISTAVAIAISGSDIYIAGSVFEGRHIYAVYWKNGNRVTLSDSSSSNQATSIAVVGTDVYVAANHTQNGSTMAAYWKNDQLIILNDTTNLDATANSIFVSGTDVYVAGQEVIYGGKSPLRIATYWKNGIATLLSDGVHDTGALSIFADGGKVSVVGYERILEISNSLAKYWVDGYSLTLSDNLGKYISYGSASSIFASGTNVYVAMQLNDPSTGVSFAQYWKDGCGVNLTTGAMSTELGGIFVVK